MKVIKAKKDQQLNIGRQGENGRLQIEFDVSDWLEEYPGATIGLNNEIPDSTESYPIANLTTSDGKSTWTITSTELGRHGYGRCQLVAIKDSVVVRSAKWRTYIEESLDGEGDDPEPWEDWKDYFIELKGDAEDAAEDAEAYAVGKRGGTDVGSTDPAYHNNSKYYAEQASDSAGSASYHKQGAIDAESNAQVYMQEAQRQAGLAANSATAASGSALDAADYAGTASTKATEAANSATEAETAAQSASAAYGTNLLAPTYSTTSSYAVGDHVIYNGGYYECNTAIGSGGESWTAAHWTQLTVGGEAASLKNEINKLDPAASASDIGKALIVKTVADGKATSYEFGETGQDDYTDLTNKPQINGVTLAGNKSLPDLGIASANDCSAKYSKPSGGIPKTDLASAVQTSLGKADTALQGQDVTTAVDAYLSANFSNPSNPPLDRTLSSSSSAAPADIVGEINNEVFTEGNILDLSQYASKNNGAVTDNGDGTFTFGTTDFGNVIWATEKEVPAGDYMLFGLPSAGGSHGFAFVNTSASYLSPKATNATTEPVSFTNNTSQVLYLGVRLNSKPTESFTISPILLVKTEKKLDKNQGSENSGKILGINETGNVVPITKVNVDQTLAVQGSAADAKATGNGFDRVNNNIVEIPNMFTDPFFADLSNSNIYTFNKISSMSVSNGVLSLATGSENNQYVYINVPNTQSTDIIYYSIKVIVSGLNGQTLTVIPIGRTHTKTADGTYTFSGYTYGGSSKKLTISLSGSNSKTLSVYCPVAINLTTLFGSGSVPALEDFELIMSGFNRDLFGKGISKEKYQFLMNHFTLMAENLAVQQPLNNYNNYITKFTKTPTDVTGTGTAVHISTDTVSIQGKATTGDVIYASVCLKVGSGNCEKLLLENDSTSTGQDEYTMAYVDSPDADTWYRLSGITIAGSMSSNHRYFKGMSVYEDSTTQDGETLSYKLGIVLNLTTIFGSGHEPMDVAVIDAMLQKFDNKWFMGTQDLWSNAFSLGMLGKIRAFSGGEYYGITDGRFSASSIINTSLPDWDYGQYNYGLNKFVVPVNNKFNGGIETNGMVSVFPKYCRWEKGAADKTGEGGSIFGGHVFEAWNNIGSYRLTMMMAHGGDEREDEACIITYCPGTFENPLVPLTQEQEENRITREPIDAYGGGTMTFMQGRIRIGSDRAGEGVVFRAKSMKCYGSVCLNGSRGMVNGPTNSGTKGDILFNDNYLYICVDDNTWKRIPLSW